MRLKVIVDIPDWYDDAECKGTSSTIFFQTDPEDTASVRIAKSICAHCKVKTECLVLAIETEQNWGIWGGMTPKERQREVTYRRV